MKLLTFSQVFPVYHSKKGLKTKFPEQILNTFGIDYKSEQYTEKLLNWNRISIELGKLSVQQILQFQNSLVPVQSFKIHTIRAKTQINENEEFQPVVWSGKPYCSPIIRFIQPLIMLNIQPILISAKECKVDNRLELNRGILAKNDGLNLDDFNTWFDQRPTFGGYILDFVTSEPYGAQDSMWK